MGRPTGWTRGSRDGNTTPKAASQGASQVAMHPSPCLPR